MIIEDVAVMAGFGMASWSSGYLLGSTILYIRKFFESV